MKTTTVALAFIVAWIFAVPTGWAQTSDDKEHAELAKALKDAKISLQRGLTASAKEGKPISAKYEVNKGYRVVSVMPALKNDHPVADVTLVKGSEWKTVSEKLD